MLLKRKLRLAVFWIGVCGTGIYSVNGFDKKDLRKDTIKTNTPQRVLHHLDNRILKMTKNITQNPQINEKLNSLAKEIVTSILTKMNAQAKIAKLTREALESTGRNKGVTAIETRRILDFISRTLSSHILTTTRTSAEPEIQRLVYGLSQTAAEVSIISALKDISYASAMSKKQAVDMSFRRKRSIVEELHKTATTTTENTTTSNLATIIPITTKKSPIIKETPTLSNQFSVLPLDKKSSIRLLVGHNATELHSKGFLNQTALDLENIGHNVNDSDAFLVSNQINNTHYVKVDDEETTDNMDSFLGPDIMEDFSDETIYKPALSEDIVAEIEIGQTEIDEDTKNEKKIRQKLDRLENKARKAILYAGDVAYYTAASVVAMRRTLTASIEVQMSIKYTQNGMSNHQELMMNLAKTAAQQTGKEAKSANSKSIACERALQLAIKYTAQSNGAKLNHVANRVIMDSIALSTIAKSMAYVSSEIAMNSLYQATEVKQNL